MMESFGTEGTNWNDSLGDLNRIGSMEEQILLNYQIQDHKALYKWLRAYYLYLYSIIKFDRTKILNDMMEIIHLINSADLDQDGKLDEFEERQSSKNLSIAMLKMEELFADLRILKVDNGLSLDLSDYKSRKYSMGLIKSIETFIDKDIIKGEVYVCNKCMSKIPKETMGGKDEGNEDQETSYL